MFCKYFKRAIRFLLLTSSLFVYAITESNKSNAETFQEIHIKKLQSLNSFSFPDEDEFSETSSFTYEADFIDPVAKFKLVQKKTNPISLIKESKTVLQDKKAFKYLQFILSKYRKQNVYIKITKKTHIDAIKRQTTEEGDLYLEKSGKFRIAINSQPASLLLFDGSFLWYQPDREEKLVLKFDSHPQINLFSSLFNYEKLFNLFSVVSIRQKKTNHYAYILEPKEKIKPVSKIILSCGKNINGVKILWEGLGDWQYYIFSNIWFRKYLSKNLFVFNTKNFEVLDGKMKSKSASTNSN